MDLRGKRLSLCWMTSTTIAFTIHWKEIGRWEEREVRVFSSVSFPLGSPQAFFLEVGHGFYYVALSTKLSLSVGSGNCFLFLSIQAHYPTVTSPRVQHYLCLGISLYSAHIFINNPFITFASNGQILNVSYISC